MDKFTTLFAVVDLFGKLMVPLIAVIAVYIAYQQWRTSNQKLKLDLFEKRYLIYQNVMEVIRKVISSGGSKYEYLDELHFATRDTDFLFGADIKVYLEKLRTNLIDLTVLTEKYKTHISGVTVDEDFSASNDQSHELRLWFGNQFSDCQKVFSKYLNMHNA